MARQKITGGVTLFYVPPIEIIEHERKFALEPSYSNYISIDCHYNKHEFFNLDLQNNNSQYKIEKYVASF